MNLQSIKAGITYFALVFGAGFCLGALRVIFVVPRFGERVAELAEMPLMLAVTVFAARYVVRKLQLPTQRSSRLSMGLVGLSLLLSAELLLAVILQDRSLSEYIASRDPVSGSVYLALLVVFALMPLFVSGEKGTRRSG